MKKILGRVVILLCVFAGCVIVFSLLINRKTTIKAVSEGGPTLPVMYMQVSGKTVNQMQGYVNEIKPSSERNSLTPLPSDRTLNIEFNTYGNTIKQVSYAVNSLSDGTLIENGEIQNLTQGDGDTLTGTFRLNNPIRSGQEYSLSFTVERSSGKTLYYYTRLVQSGSEDLSGYLSFAQTFSESCLDKSQKGTLEAYLETDDSQSGSDFHDINIHSDPDLVTWGDLSPEIVKKAIPQIKEINSETCSIEMDYVISSKNKDGETEYYTVSDFFRMRYDQTETVLLNFQRSATQIFDAGLSAAVADNGLNLGVESNSVPYLSNKAGDIAAFVVNGELWSYNRSLDRAVQIFSFRSESGSDERTENSQHAITIENLSEGGNITFLVYGYMSSGAHEGEEGIAIYYFDAEQNTTVEKYFLPAGEGFESMEKDLSRLCYYDAEKQTVDMFLGTQIVKADLRTGSCSTVKDGLDSDTFFASDDQKYVAWQDGTTAYDCTQATVMDLTSGKTRTVSSGNQEKLRGIGFMDEDFVYGLCQDTDIVSDPVGNVTQGLYKICIENMDGVLQKSYQKDGVYIIGTTQTSGDLELELASRTETGFTAAGTDHIIRSSNSTSGVKLEVSSDSRAQDQQILTFTYATSALELQVQEAEYLDPEKNTEVQIDLPDISDGNYLIYAYGKLEDTCADAGKAVQEADALDGVVLNSSQTYIWERGNWPESITLDASSFPAALESTALDQNALRSALGDGYTVLNLSGCSRECLYYFIGKGYPVLAKWSDTETVLILGYDGYNIWVYDAAAGKRAIATDDADAAFAAAGSLFLGYMAG